MLDTTLLREPVHTGRPRYEAPSAKPAVAAEPAPSKSLTYRPEIDGLRAIAVIPVILFHLGITGFSGGNLGVDVFFVISGFLITSIVKREADAGRFRFANFWARRIRRIAPAMLAVTCASLVFTCFFVYRPDQAAIGKQASWSLLSGANIYFWKFVGSYWGLAASQSPFLHMWSLAVEEQFYIFLPPAVWLVYRYSPRFLLASCLAVFALSFAAFLYFVHRNPQAAFYLLPTRAWELAAGCTLAVINPRNRRGWHGFLGALGLLVIIASYHLADAFGWGNVIAVFGSVLVIAFARQGIAYRILANRGLVYIGQLSYSLYLWHWPVIAFPAFMGTHLQVWQSLLLSLGLAVASYYAIERPTRHAKGIVPFMIGGMLIALGFSLAMGSRRHFYDTSAFNEPTLYIRALDCNPTPPPIDDTWTGMKILPSRFRKDDFVHGGLLTGQGTPRVVMLGDSHATFWGPVVRDCTDKLNVPASFWLMSGVDPFFSVPPVKRTAPWFLSADDLLRYDQARIDLLKEWRPEIVLVATRWSVRSLKGTKPFVDYLCEHAGHVFLIEQAPELPIGDRNSMQYLAYKGYVPQDNVKQYFEAANREGVQRGRALIRELAAGHPNCSVIPTADLYERGDKTLVLDGRKVVFMDDDHLTNDGAFLARRRIEQSITTALAEKPAEIGRLVP